MDTQPFHVVGASSPDVHRDVVGQPHTDLDEIFGNINPNEDRPATEWIKRTLW